MPPACNLKHRRFDHLRAAPARFGGAFGLPSRNIEPRQRLRGSGNGLAGLDRLADQFLEVRFLRCQCVTACFGNPAGFFVQCQRVETHGPGHGLTMGKTAVRGHQCIGVLGGNLNKIAQHAIVADLERGDPSAIAVLRLKRGNRPAGIARCFA